MRSASSTAWSKKTTTSAPWESADRSCVTFRAMETPTPPPGHRGRGVVAHSGAFTEAIRLLRRRLSDVVYRSLKAVDASNSQTTDRLLDMAARRHGSIGRSRSAAAAFRFRQGRMAMARRPRTRSFRSTGQDALAQIA